MNMDDMKNFAKNKKKLESLILTVRILSQDIEIKYGIVKFAMLKRKDKNSENRFNQSGKLLNT